MFACLSGYCLDLRKMIRQLHFMHYISRQKIIIFLCLNSNNKYLYTQHINRKRPVLNEDPLPFSQIATNAIENYATEKYVLGENHTSTKKMVEDCNFGVFTVIIPVIKTNEQTVVFQKF